MSQVENYKQLVERVFGNGVSGIDEKKDTTNNVLGALASKTDFGSFKYNFEARLNRLCDAYREHRSREALLTQVDQVADEKNWQGAVAELAAIDFFNFSREHLVRPPDLDVSISATRALARQYGRSTANLDVHFAEPDIFTDVKTFKDNVGEILDGVYQQVWRTKRPTIQAEHRSDISSDVIRDRRAELVERIKNSVEGGGRPERIDCTDIVDGLVFNLLWGAGCVTALREYSPYRHAENYHLLPFWHARKFVVDRPFFLTFVVFPWFNGVVTSFENSNTTLYRALARRVFCQYMCRNTAMSTLDSKYAGSETLWEVSRNLGGILFLEDNSILGTAKDQPNVGGFYFENPNATHTPSTGMFGEYLKTVATEYYDDFRYDNY